MIWRYADRPLEMFRPEKVLPKLDADKCWFAQQKLDGWLTNIVKDGKLSFLSRRDKAKGGPTPIPVKPEIIAAVEALELPDKTHLVGEWLNRRTIGECPERLYLFDVMCWSDQSFCEMGALERWNFLMDKVGELKGDLAYPLYCDCNFLSFFNEQTKIPYTEGIVLKHVRGKVKGDNERGIDNGMLVKVKWRSGSSGRDIVEL
jgi:hypothetical protein